MNFDFSLIEFEAQQDECVVDDVDEVPARVKVCGRSGSELEDARDD